MSKDEKQQIMLYRIPPFHYIHVIDLNTNVSTIEIGPQTFLRQDNQKVILSPTKMTTVPPQYFCIIENPVVRDKDGKVVKDANGEAKLAFADLEIRFSGEPFPLYPGEIMKDNVKPLEVVSANSALKVVAKLDFVDNDGVKRIAGDEWLVEGPCTYIPRKEVDIVEEVKAIVIKPNQGLRLRATRDATDRNNVRRVTGEEWIEKKCGAYLPGAYEVVVGTVDAIVLTNKKALHIRALRSFKDDFDKKRLNGEEWLVTSDDTETYIPSVYEEIVSIVNVTSLTSRQYCVILDPVDPETNKTQLGKKRLVKGEKSFFLKPGEHLQNGIQSVFVLCEDEGLVLRAIESFEDDAKAKKVAGDKWMIHGPLDYVPPIEVEVVVKHKAIALDKNEGIYVRNIKTGVVKTVIGETYTLNENEELWEKHLPEKTEHLISSTQDRPYERRDKTRLVSYYLPHNKLIKVFDNKTKASRLLFGPEIVLLRADEHLIPVTPLTILLDIIFFFVYFFYLFYSKIVSFTRLNRQE